MFRIIKFDKETGEFVDSMGSYPSASAARTACMQKAGEVLTWTRGAGVWEAQHGSVIFQVPAESQVSAEAEQP